MPWAALDDQFHSNPKLVTAGLEATGLHARAISYCACYLTDGFVSATWANGAAPKRVINALVSAGLWHKIQGGFELNDYLDFNPSKAEIEARRAAKAAGGKLGAKRRWSPDDDGTSDRSSHGSTHDSSHGISDSKPNGKTMARARGRRAAPTPLSTERSKEPVTCPDCGPIHLPATVTLDQHRANVHGIDPEPEPAFDGTEPEEPA
ncbi:MAG: hypothetical protein M3537_11070 [Chloroflexota bacterium]|nr:hypothetical protein [Chloroflexota bacterium]